MLPVAFRRLQTALFVALVAFGSSVFADDASSPTSAAPGQAVRPLKVFILAGQSNMQGHAHVSTLDSLAGDPRTAALLGKMRDANGKPRVCEKVWISSVGCAGDGWSDVIEQTGKLTAGFGASPEKIGPEYSFGICLEQTLHEPILIIKTAWGGRSLVSDFRPPSAGERVFSDFIQERWKERGVDPVKEAARHNAELVGVFYRHMLAHVKKVLADIQRRRARLRSAAGV